MKTNKNKNQFSAEDIALINDQRIQTLLLLRQEGVSIKEIAEKHSTTHAHISRMLKSAVREIERAKRVAAVLEGKEKAVDVSLRDFVCNRTWTILVNAELETVGRVLQKTEAELLKYRNFGRKSLNEVKDALARLGVHLPGTNLTEASQFPIHGLLQKAGYTEAAVRLFEEMFSALGMGFRIARRG